MPEIIVAVLLLLMIYLLTVQTLSFNGYRFCKKNKECRNLTCARAKECKWNSLYNKDYEDQGKKEHEK